MKKVERPRRKKIGTALDEKLLTAVKVLAAKEHKRLSQVIEEALAEYLRRKRPTSVVLQTQGAIKIAPELLHRILEEEPGVFEV
jgi:metal-responsive CopG/Arc/MetJ family transcriptional regulator